MSLKPRSPGRRDQFQGVSDREEEKAGRARRLASKGWDLPPSGDPLLRAADRFSHPASWVNQLWQVDLTDLKVIGWSGYHLSTVLDNYSRFIFAWRLYSGMAASDVSATLKAALAFAEPE